MMKAVVTFWNTVERISDAGDLEIVGATATLVALYVILWAIWIKP